MHAAGRFFAAVSVSLVCSTLASAQQGPRPPREVRGLIKSVDAKTRAIVVLVSEGGAIPVEKTYKTIPDVEIALGDGTPRRVAYQSGKFDDLAAGSLVTLTLTDDDSVTSLLAQGPAVRAVLRSVDAGKRQITVETFPTQRDQAPESKKYTLAADAELGIDDGRGRRSSIREAKLAELLPGAPVALQLSANQKEVQSVVAEGPSLFGVVRSLDVEKRQLTIAASATRPGEEPTEKTLELAEAAAVWLDDGRGRRLSVQAGKLADVPIGAVVRIRLTPDQKAVANVTAEGPSQAGLVRAIDAAKRSITVALFTARDQQPEEKTLSVAADARITIDGQPAKLDEIKPSDNGPFANLRLSLDQQSVQAITIVQNR